jgi:23S rRNA pseudouridine2605 synthase
MSDEFKHPADAPEQEITSTAAELVEPAVQAELKEGFPIATAPETALLPSEEDSPKKTESPERTESELETGLALKLERLQKILAQAGIASRRHAEELITQGRVQVNGQTVTVLGSKADPARDHIRVDGKLLHGAERLRYFVLNKPKGFVTTVSDPEGRPTVMKFFAKQNERLYPVGRLDYQSEGLLLVTNDGELANRLTKAASGVEKTYLVKVAGQPSEASLDRLRQGVAIEREKPGGNKVHTAPARIRPVRSGENPWFEVVLIEGRNRELRKMFEEIGHYVEKIRRVGYGPLVLDLEPGKMRELDAEEVRALQLTAEGKLKPRRPKTLQIPPADVGRTAEARVQRTPTGPKDFRPRDDRRGKTVWLPDKRRESLAPNRRKNSRGGAQEFRRPDSERPASNFGAKSGSGLHPESDLRSGPGLNSRPGPRGGERPGFAGRERSGFETSRPSRIQAKPGMQRPFSSRDDARQASQRFDRGASANRPFRVDPTSHPSAPPRLESRPADRRPPFGARENRPPQFKRGPASFSKGPGKPDVRPPHRAGSTTPFRGKGKTGPGFGDAGRSSFGGGKSRSGFGAKAKPAFGSTKPNPAFGSKTRPAFESKPKTFASKPRSGSSRPATAPGGKGGEHSRQRFGARPGGKRSGPPGKGKKRS